ncbi:3-ketoacyl-thiolase, partial [Moniliophthora roreri]
MERWACAQLCFCLCFFLIVSHNAEYFFLSDHNLHLPHPIPCPLRSVYPNVCSLTFC